MWRSSYCQCLQFENVFSNGSTHHNPPQLKPICIQIFTLPPVKWIKSNAVENLLDGPALAFRQSAAKLCAFTTTALLYSRKKENRTTTEEAKADLLIQLNIAWYHFYYFRPFRQFIQTSTRCKMGGFVFRSPLIFTTTALPPQSRYPLLPYLSLRYSNPKFTVVHNSINFITVLFHITLPLWGYWGPLWPSLPLSIIIIDECIFWVQTIHV